MPFTVSHVAAVLPAYRPLSRAHLFSAAVIGSMVPDFGMLVPGFSFRWQTHSLMALWTFCLPMGLAALALTLLLVKPAIVEIAPDGAYARLRSAEEAPRPRSWDSPRSWLYAAVVILLSALLHLVWDGFTHENARGVRMFPVLGAYGPELEGHSLHIWRWLQYGSSALGLIAVAAALWLWLRHASVLKEGPLPRRLRPLERRLWTALYIGLPLIAAGLSWWQVRARPWAIGAKMEVMAVVGMRTTILSLLCVSAAVLLRVAFKRQAAQP